MRGDAVRFLSGLPSGAPFNIVFVDPPYASGLDETVLRLLCAPGLLAADAVVVVEHATDRELPEEEGGLRRFRQKRYGGTSLDLYRPADGRAGRKEET